MERAFGSVLVMLVVVSRGQVELSRMVLLVLVEQGIVVQLASVELVLLGLG